MQPSHASIRYLKKQFSRGRSPLARALDYLALRILIFLAALLFFRQRVYDGRIALLLSAITLSAVMVLLKIIREYRFEAFCKRERHRLSKHLFFRTLCRLPESKLRLLARPLAADRRLILLHRAEKADADAVLAASGIDDTAALLATGGYTEAARAFANDVTHPIALIDPEDLFPIAKRAGCTPAEAEIDREMARILEDSAQKRRARAGLAFSGTFPGKYFICSFCLIVLSFFTNYALYYRLLALFSMGIASVGAILSLPREQNLES